MKRPPHGKKFVVLSDSLNHHLNMYAVAAGAAGVGMLASAPPAEARIVYTPAFQQISGSTFYLDLNRDGINDFEVAFLFGGTTGFSSAALYFFGANRSTSNAIWVGTCSRCASALPGGVRIGGTNPSRFSKSANDMARINVLTNHSGRHYSFQWPWANGGKGVKDRYLGLRFSVAGQTHYGWARFNVTLQPASANQKIIATLTGYAYETVPNKPIVTGDTGPFVSGKGAPQASLSKPASPSVSLGLLALGTSGLEIWRREEKL